MGFSHLGTLEIDFGSRELEEAERARRAGRRYALVRSPSEILVGAGDLPSSTCDEGLILAGDLSRLCFGELVSLVAQSRASGLLRVIGSGGMEKALSGYP